MGSLEYVLVLRKAKQVHFILSMRVGVGEQKTNKCPLQIGMEKTG